MMDFGAAIEALKQGKKVTRKGWNGAGQYLYYVPSASYRRCTEAARDLADENDMVKYHAYIAMKGVDGIVFPWTVCISDVLEEDWEIVE